MPELNLKQISDKLNAEFTGEGRKLIFWYDNKAEFAEDVDSLELANAKVLRLAPDNQFKTKYFLERVDRTTNYLVYAPFPRPNPRDNHLADTLLYSRQFSADRASLLLADLGIDSRYKPLLQKYIKFFAAKERTQRFYELEIGLFTQETIETGLLSALCKTHTASFEEVLRVVLTAGELDYNKFLAEFEKYDLLAAFWRLCEEQFGYVDANPTLEKLAVTLFATYTEKHLHGELPKAWRSFVSFKSGTIIAFLDNLMNHVLYREKYDELSDHVAKVLGAAAAFEAYDAEALLDCDTFAVIDPLLLRWATDKLLRENHEARLGGLDIPAICRHRRKKHFGGQYYDAWLLIENAQPLILAATYQCRGGFQSIAERYANADWRIDSHYRQFTFHYDCLPDPGAFEKLRELVENIYTNEYLGQLTVAWSVALGKEDWQHALPLQRRFFDHYVDCSKDRVVVIVSDALRYETGRELWERLQADEKCTVSIEPMLGVLPSYTKLGMAALLPHRTLEITDDGKVLTDGLPVDDLKQRELILQQRLPHSRCVRFDEVKTMKKTELREIFTGMDVVYVYHNQIDARGDKPSTENEVFIACAEAVEEIYALIKRLSVNANTYHFIVTADHGFLYKRDKLQESDKIEHAAKCVTANRRFILAAGPVSGDGIASLPLGAVLGSGDSKVVSFPVGTQVFKMAGGGQNYVHGGSSPQEMIIPVIDVKTEKGRMETRAAQIVLVSMVQKITNLISSLDFMQTEPVSDVVKPARYRIYFVNEGNERISSECLHTADSREADPQKRIFRLRFNFKNRQYDKTGRYYLVAVDEKTDLEVLRHDVVMDLAFANNFGFNV